MFEFFFRALFLLLSAMVLTYKVVALQARLDMVVTPSSHWNSPTYDKYVPMSTNSVFHDPLENDALLIYVCVLLFFFSFLCYYVLIHFVRLFRNLI